MKTSKNQARDRRLKNNAIASLAREQIAHQRDNWLHEGELRNAEKQIQKSKEETHAANSKAKDEMMRRKQAEDELRWIADGFIDRQDWEKVQEIRLAVRVPVRLTVSSFAERGILSAMKHLFNAARLESSQLRDLGLGERVKALSSVALEQIKYKFVSTYKPTDRFISNAERSEVFDAAVEAIKEAASKVNPAKFPIQHR